MRPWHGERDTSKHRLGLHLHMAQAQRFVYPPFVQGRRVLYTLPPRVSAERAEIRADQSANLHPTRCFPCCLAPTRHVFCALRGTPCGLVCSLPPRVQFYRICFKVGKGSSLICGAREFVGVHLRRGGMCARCPSPSSRRRRLALRCTACARSAAVRRGSMRDGRDTRTMSTKSNHARNVAWTPQYESSMRSFTSSYTSAKRANVRSNRTGKSVPTAGSGWTRTARAAAIRCRRPVRMPAPAVAWHYHRARREGCLVHAVGGVLYVEISPLSKLTRLCFTRDKLSGFSRYLHL